MAVSMLMYKRIGLYTRIENLGEYVFDIIASIILIVLIMFRGFSELLLKNYLSSLIGWDLLRAVSIVLECIVIIMFGLNDVALLHT